MTYTIAVYTVKNFDDGQRNCPKHVEFYSKNKFEKLVHLVGLLQEYITMHGHLNVQFVSLKFGCYYLLHVPASKPVNHA